MKRRICILAIICGLVLSTACILNPSLKEAQALSEANIQGMIGAYEEAINRTFIERIGVEEQYVDLMSSHILLMNAFRVKTGIDPDSIKNEAFLSIDQLEKHNKMIDEAREKRILEIRNSYLSLMERVDQAKAENAELDALVNRIRTRQRQQRMDWMRYLELVKNKSSEGETDGTQ